MANEKKIPVGGWLDPTTPEHILGSSSDIIDEETGKRQSEINAHILDAINQLEYNDTVIVKTKNGLKKITVADLRLYANYGLTETIEEV